jgi:hypothetical protein
MVEKATELMKCYFTQLTVGCDCLSCDQVDCRSCPAFRHEVKDKTSAAVLAVELILEHFDRKLCPGLSPLVGNPGMVEKLSVFDTLASSLMSR